MTTDSYESWQDRLMWACHKTADTRGEEEDFFRQEAAEAPLDELRIFLASPGGMYSDHARAVMGEVLRQREGDIAKKESRKDQWRGIWQQVSAQVIVKAIVALIALSLMALGLGVGDSFLSWML